METRRIIPKGLRPVPSWWLVSGRGVYANSICKGHTVVFLKESPLGRRSGLKFAFVPADANAFVNVALAAVRANDYAGGVIALQEVQRIPGVTANQLMAIHGTMQAMTADLVARAAKGDPKAKADLAAIEKTRSQ